MNGKQKKNLIRLTTKLKAKGMNQSMTLPHCHSNVERKKKNRIIFTSTTPTPTTNNQTDII